MTETLQLDRANLISLWLEAVLFGAFITLCIIALYILLVKRQHGKIHVPMTVSSLLMLILITSHMIYSLTRAITAFTTPSTTANEYYSNISGGSQLAQSTIYYLLSLVGDAVVAHRCWVVWKGNQYVAMTVTILFIFNVLTGAIRTYAMMSIKPNQAIFTSDFSKWALLFYALTLITNALCTMLIASRIWYTSKAVDRYQTGKKSAWNAAMILIESAALYSATLLAMIATYVSGSNAQYITQNILSPMVGIVFEVIIVRVGMGISPVDSTTDHSTQIRSIGLPPLPLRPIKVRITSEVCRSANHSNVVDSDVNSYSPRNPGRGNPRC